MVSCRNFHKLVICVSDGSSLYFSLVFGTLVYTIVECHRFWYLFTNPHASSLRKKLQFWRYDCIVRAILYEGVDLFCDVFFNVVLQL